MVSLGMALDLVLVLDILLGCHLYMAHANYRVQIYEVLESSVLNYT